MSRAKKRYTPFFGGNAIRGQASTSDSVTVWGRRELPGASLSEQSEELSFLARKARRLTKSKLAAIQARDTAKHQKLMKESLSRAQHQELNALQHQVADNNNGIGADDIVMNDEWTDVEEDQDANSDDGSEHEAAVVQELGLSSDSGTSAWSDRLSKENEAWKAQVSALCDNYLTFVAGTQRTHPPPEPINPRTITVRCISMKSEAIQSFAQLESDPWVNATLLRHGYLAPTPTRPTVAFSLDLLELLAMVQKRGPSISIQVMAKVFCDLRNVPYTDYFRTQLTSALDAYLLVLREVQRRVKTVLARDGPDWRLKNDCPACTYKLEEEPPLRYIMLMTCDGNDSLKRCQHAAPADVRTYDSDYYISRSEVDRFQEEVANSRKSTKRKNKAREEKSDEKSECERRWKNAGADARPDSVPRKYFDETGVFVSTCRHSFVLTVCDMVKSGERAKYGLATIDKLITAFGPNLLMGYDIGCTFKGTVNRSALLGDRAREFNFDLCVGSFHGPAHNRACQVKNHPHNRPGTGLTDFENCETLFSSSNRLASTTRLASRFHRHQKIDIYLDGWNDDAYMNLGSLLYRKYVHALEVIESSTDFLARFPAGEAEFKDFFQEEVNYMESFKTEVIGDLFSIKYVELLERLEIKQLEFNECMTMAKDAEPSGLSDLRRLVLSSQAESRRHQILDQLMVLQDAVQKLEDSHMIPRANRWIRGQPKWEEAQQLRYHSHFYECLDELERLIVQRVLELSRAGLMGTGYKLRVHIMKSLAARSTAIKSALNRYNKAAAELVPPAPKLTWEQVADATILADCHILRGSRRRVVEQPWAKPENRRCVEQYHRLLRAHEEVERLNVEIRRLSTSISDEAKLLPEVVARTTSTNPSLAWAVQQVVERRLAVNQIVLSKLNAIRLLRGYTGTHSDGIRVGTVDIARSLGSAESQTGGSPPTSQISNGTDYKAQEVPGCEASFNEKHVDHEGLEVNDDVAHQFDQWQSMLENAG